MGDHPGTTKYCWASCRVNTVGDGWGIKSSLGAENAVYVHIIYTGNDTEGVGDALPKFKHTPSRTSVSACVWAREKERKS